ncbi:hypothetical protein Cylst_0144 [Cylindrospermum stagnale PCC 7417]|uniref:Uncharacterized protein n=1 Tax=Cylindrospermum stagnale PCC 7417 TaxID=56107 RepID=K9WRW2_9NOST|nr:hypothetical protein Cylst_0144 [Cylindrospermum stagnale PCC 7417]
MVVEQFCTKSDIRYSGDNLDEMQVRNLRFSDFMLLIYYI